MVSGHTIRYFCKIGNFRVTNGHQIRYFKKSLTKYPLYRLIRSPASAKHLSARTLCTLLHNIYMYFNIKERVQKGKTDYLFEQPLK